MSPYLLGVDIGTSAIKAAVFDSKAVEVGSHTAEYSLLTPRAGWVELDADTYPTTFAIAARRALQDSAVDPGDVAAVGLSAQGETMQIGRAHV